MLPKLQGKLLSIGEVLVRLSTSKNSSLESNQLNFYVGGDSLNVASNVGNWTGSSKYLTVYDFNSFFAKAINAHLKINNVENVSIHSEGRVGTYYTIDKTDFNNLKVFYDRKYSSYALIKDLEPKFENILKDVAIIYVSGITIAINDAFNAYLLKLLEQAKSKNITIVFDLNYRSKLWDSFEQFKEAAQPFVALSDVVIGWIEDTYTPVVGELSKEYFANAVSQMIQNYPNIKVVTTPFKFKKDDKAHVKGLLYKDGQFYETDYVTYNDKYPIGSGDSFAGAFLSSLLKNLDNESIIKNARNAYAIKNIFEGDNNNASWDEITSVANKSSKIER